MTWRGTLLLILLTGMLSACTTPNGLVRQPTPSWTAPLASVGIDGTVQNIAYPKNYKIHQISSADPSGANNDGAHAAATFEGGKILADLTGPGAILRIWAESPGGNLAVYVDGEQQPSIYLPFDMFFSQQFPLFDHHLTGRNENGGYYWYVPIPYKSSCRVIAFDAPADMPYQVTYADLHPSTPVESFNPVLTKDEKRFFQGWNNAWEEASNVRFVQRENELFHKSSRILYPLKDILVLPLDGPGTITELEMKFASVDPTILHKLWLTIYIDGETEPSVFARVGEFFGTGNPMPGNYGGLAVGNRDGLMWCRYPMPFLHRAEIRLINTSNEAVDFAYDITWRPGPPDRQLKFYARHNEAVTVAGQPYTVMAVNGAGHFVGCTLTMTGGTSFEYLEGDETIMVDGEPAGRYTGTGTDHYFNAGWYAPAGTYSYATHAVTGKDLDTYSFTANRSHIVDAIPFDQSFVFQLEHGGQNDQPGVHYSSVAYWYQMRPYTDLWPVPGIDLSNIRGGHLAANTP